MRKQAETRFGERRSMFRAPESETEAKGGQMDTINARRVLRVVDATCRGQQCAKTKVGVNRTCPRLYV